MAGFQAGDDEGGVGGGEDLQVGEMVEQCRDDAALPGGVEVVFDFVDEEDGGLVHPFSIELIVVNHFEGQPAYPEQRAFRS